MMKSYQDNKALVDNEIHNQTLPNFKVAKLDEAEVPLIKRKFIKKRNISIFKDRLDCKIVSPHNIDIGTKLKPTVKKLKMPKFLRTIKKHSKIDRKVIFNFSSL